MFTSSEYVVEYSSEMKILSSELKQSVSLYSRIGHQFRAQLLLYGKALLRVFSLILVLSGLTYSRNARWLRIVFNDLRVRSLR